MAQKYFQEKNDEKGNCKILKCFILTKKKKKKFNMHEYVKITKTC